MKGTQMAAIRKLSRLATFIALAAGLAACGRVSAGGGQPAAPAASGSAPAPFASATGGGTAVTVAAVPPGAGSATAGTGSAAPAITVSGPVTPAGPPTTVPPSLTGSVTLTVADNGAVVYLRVGQQVTVVLTPAFMAWHLPIAGGSALRRVSASGGFPGRQPARAVFLAVAPGTAILSAESDTACLHARPPCMVPQQLWHVTVRVSGG
jgi:hypothetical protein